MSTPTSFNSTVAARTRAAKTIRDTPELLAIYEKRGGLKRDLDRVVAAGEQAEAANRVQGEAQAAGGDTVGSVRADFEALKLEHADIRSVLPVVRHELEAAGVASATLHGIDHVLADTREVGMSAAKAPQTLEAAGENAEAPAAPKKHAHRKESDEAVRAEVAKNAGELIDLCKQDHAFAKALVERGVKLARLEALQRKADALTAGIATRDTGHATAQAATAAEHQATADQSRAWRACYPILHKAGHDDPRIPVLLHAAASPR